MDEGAAWKGAVSWQDAELAPCPRETYTTRGPGCGAQPAVVSAWNPLWPHQDGEVTHCALTLSFLEQLLAARSSSAHRVLNKTDTVLPSCSLLPREGDCMEGQQYTLIQFNAVAQSCPTLCDPMDCSLPLEGKPRTPLSSRVATRVSWSPLSGLKRGSLGAP